MAKTLTAGEVLTAMMRAHCLSGEALAALMGVDPMQISRIRRNVIPITRRSAALLGRVFSTGAKFWLELSIHDDLNRIENDQPLQRKLSQITPIADQKRP